MVGDGGDAGLASAAKVDRNAVDRLVVDGGQNPLA
jgi:hypothetical protein